MKPRLLHISCGADLESFVPTTIKIGKVQYRVLTGYEAAGSCAWCGEKLTGMRRRYCCEEHLSEYYRHFEWGSASEWAKARAGCVCDICNRSIRLDAHHITPLKGERSFSPYNLPWNLRALCRTCHQKTHAAMRGTGNSRGQMVLL